MASPALDGSLVLRSEGGDPSASRKSCAEVPVASEPCFGSMPFALLHPVHRRMSCGLQNFLVARAHHAIVGVHD